MQISSCQEALGWERREKGGEEIGKDGDRDRKGEIETDILKKGCGGIFKR